MHAEWEPETCSQSLSRSGSEKNESDSIQYDDLEYMLQLLKSGKISLFEEMASKHPQLQEAFMEILEILKKIQQFEALFCLKRQDFPTLDIRLNEINMKIKSFTDFYQQWKQQELKKKRPPKKKGIFTSFCGGGDEVEREHAQIEKYKVLNECLRVRVDELLQEKEHSAQIIATQMARKIEVIKSLKLEKRQMVEEFSKNLKSQKTNQHKELIQEEERQIKIQKERNRDLKDLEEELLEGNQELRDAEDLLAKVVERKLQEVQEKEEEIVALQQRTDELNQMIKRQQELLESVTRECELKMAE